MTAEAQRSKNFFRLNGGLNTELNELNFVDGFTTDEANYELLVDGSRRRRKGLAAESGAGSAYTVPSFSAGELSQTFLWENVGGDPDKSLMVYRKGTRLFFADADETISDSWYSGTGKLINLVGYYTDDGTDALVRAAPCTFAEANGNLIVGNQYIKTFYVAYNATTDDFTGNIIPLYMRDYTTIDEGKTLTDKPTTLSADHKYNLRNRGMKQANIDAFNSSKGYYPNLTMRWFFGYERTVDESTASAVEKWGVQSWSPDRMDAEAFGNSSAPVGSLFISPYDTTGGYGNEAVAGINNINSWTDDAGSPSWTVTITTAAAHGLSGTDEVTITGNIYEYNSVVATVEQASLDGTYTTTYSATPPQSHSTEQFDITYTPPADFSSMSDRDYQLGQIDSAGQLARSTGTAHGDGPRAVQFHDGRVFYAGWKNSEFADYILFSQIADSPKKYGKCYQDADPTDENFNAVTPADGGYMVIPGMSGVRKMVSLRNSLLVFTNKGVWEISGGRAGVFTANGYTVRKVTDIPCNSAMSPLAIENSVMFTGPGGIYVIAPNQYTGILEAQSASEFTIQTLWNQIPDSEQQRVQSAYDFATKRVYFMYGPNGTTNYIDTMLIYDLKIGAWFKYTFDTPANNGLLTGFSIANADDTSDNKKMKFLYQASATTVQVADFDQTDFDDWDGSNGPLPYLVFGHDNMGDFQKRRQAPIITVYSQRTETGYTDTGNGWDPVNTSSTLMTAYWDWTEPDDATVDPTVSVSNKIDNQQEVYRHVRAFTPSAADDVDGYPVVVTRNKVRGRGRALQLRFDGAADKDSHILGFTVNYKMTRRI